MRRFQTLILLFIVLIWVVPIRGSGKREGEPRRVEITARRYSFQPNVITLQKGEPVELVVRSVDVPHGMHFDDLSIDLIIRKGVDTEAQFTPDKAGDFVGHCSVFCGEGHGGMEITFHVVE
jgi:cytochrome c oxidase subunit 2